MTQETVCFKDELQNTSYKEETIELLDGFLEELNYDLVKFTTSNKSNYNIYKTDENAYWIEKNGSLEDCAFCIFNFILDSLIYAVIQDINSGGKDHESLNKMVEFSVAAGKDLGFVDPDYKLSVDLNDNGSNE